MAISNPTLAFPSWRMLTDLEAVPAWICQRREPFFSGTSLPAECR